MSDIKTVSTIGIDEGIDNLTKTISGLDEQVGIVIEAYKSLSNQGILSSANIDQITNEIRTKFSNLKNDFDNLAADIKTNMAQSSETIASQRSSLEGILGKN